MNMPDFGFIPMKIIEETLSQTPKPGKHMLDPFSAYAREQGIPAGILEDFQFPDYQPEAHLHEKDLFVCIEGVFTFLVKGELSDAYKKEGSEVEIKGKEIIKGAEVILKAGDHIWIPAGMPHAHKSAYGRAWIYKFIEPNIFPLEEVPGWKAAA